MFEFDTTFYSAARRNIGYFYSKITQKIVSEEHELTINDNKAAQWCAIAHKVPTPLIHTIGIIVYQMSNR